MKKVISLLLVLSVILCCGTAAAENGGYVYKHDPRENAEAMADIIENPDAVYGFSPDPASKRLGSYADYDWTDPVFVAKAQEERRAYHQSMETMTDILYRMREKGASIEEMARAVSAERNRLRLAACQDEDSLATLRESNLKTYGHEDGPTPEQLFEKYGSWTMVMQKAFSPNMGMDACCGLYDEYYQLYIELGYVENTPAETSRTTKLTARFATVEEGRQLMRERTLFHEQIAESTLAFFLQRKGETLEEYIEYSADQVLPFSPEEEQRVNDTLAWLQEKLEQHGLQLPDPGEITFVKSTCEEALGSAGYTSAGTVFLGQFTYSPEYYTDDMFRRLVVHEISHCLSRLFPEYRRALYSLIHFTVLDQDIEVPEEIRNQIIANPDVEHHNSYATFTIGGEKKDCYLVFLTDSVFEKAGDTFFDGMYSGIVPLDGSRVYRVDEVDDFWDVVGRNTNYAEDPEELMATNLAYAILHLDDGYNSFSSPEILEGIIDYLKK